MVLIGQFIITHSWQGFAFAQVNFPGKDLVFILVLLQLFILPEVLIVEKLCHGVAARAVRQCSGRRHALYGQRFWHLFNAGRPLNLFPSNCTKPLGSKVAAGLGFYLKFTSLWQNQLIWPMLWFQSLPIGIIFLWPLIVTNSEDTRPLTVGLSIFGAPENGVDISIISAATLMSIAPLLITFLIFQRQFVQAFLRTGIK